MIILTVNKNTCFNEHLFFIYSAMIKLTINVNVNIQNETADKEEVIEENNRGILWWTKV